MVELVLGSAVGRVPELGSPKVESMADLMRTYLTAARRRRSVVKVPLWGRLGAGFGVGGHLLSNGDRGTVTFADYLRV